VPQRLLRHYPTCLFLLRRSNDTISLTQIPSLVCITVCRQKTLSYTLRIVDPKALNSVDSSATRRLQVQTDITAKIIKTKRKPPTKITWTKNRQSNQNRFQNWKASQIPTGDSRIKEVK